MAKQYIDKNELLNGIYSENPKDVMLYIANFPTVERGERSLVGWEEKEVFHIDEDKVIDAWQSCRCPVCKRYETKPYLYYFSESRYCSWCGAEIKGNGWQNDTD